MLTKLAFVARVALSTLVLSLAAPSGANAAPVECPEGYNTRTGACFISVTVPATQGSGSGSGPATVVDAGGSVSACQKTSGEPVPCETLDGWWVSDRQCYVKLEDPQPAVGSPLWQGHTDGAIYMCTYVYAFPVMPLSFWSASMPAGPAAPVDPAVVAQSIVEQMQLRAITIGMVPEDRPGSMGVVGLPLWMWVEAPSEQSFGPMTRSASLGGVTVTATASVSKVLWEMGDGGAVTCVTAGTPFSDGHGGQESPDCGYTYPRQGTFTVRATSFWSVDWSSSSGVSGSIPLQFTASRIVQIGELQVVRVG